MPKKSKKSRSAPRGGLLTYELTAIADLKPAECNVRKHSARQIANLKRSVMAFGLVSPVVRDSENRIVAGHGRVEAAKRAGLTEVPTLLLDKLNDQQRRLFAIADNVIAEQASWDEGLLALELQDLQLKVPDLDLSLSGLSHSMIDLSIARLTQTDWSDLDNCPEEIPTAPMTRIGDVWDFPGGHTLVCGDCTDAAVVSTAVGDERIRLVATDPPFNRPAKDYSSKGRFKHDEFVMGAGEMSQEGFRAFLAASFEAVRLTLIDGALIYAFMDGQHIADLIEAGEHAGFNHKTVITWDKGTAGLGGMYRSATEFIALFKLGKAPHVNTIPETRKLRRDRQTIWRYPGMNQFSKGRERALSWHATIKPVQMLCDLILDASHRGERVYDGFGGFGGSGSTLVAAEKVSRRASLVEIDPRYCDVAIERFRLAFGAEPTERTTGMSFRERTEAVAIASERGDG